MSSACGMNYVWLPTAGVPIPFVVIPAVLLGEDYHDGSDTKVLVTNLFYVAIYNYTYCVHRLIQLLNILCYYRVTTCTCMPGSYSYICTWLYLHTVGVAIYVHDYI